MNIFCGDVAARSLGTPIELMVLKKLYSTELLVSDSHLKLCSVAVSRCIVVLFIFDVFHTCPITGKFCCRSLPCSDQLVNQSACNQSTAPSTLRNLQLGFWKPALEYVCIGWKLLSTAKYIWKQTQSLYDKLSISPHMGGLFSHYMPPEDCEKHQRAG